MKKSLFVCIMVALATVMIMSNGCKKATLPEVVTTEVTGVALTSAISGGEITKDGGDEITEKGVCWNISGEPTVADTKTSEGGGAESYTSNLPGLQKGSVYYVRAYATNSVGTAYGEEIVFSTKMDDVDGNQYATIKIGTQLWMAENLKTTKYNDNTQIPNVTSNTAWIALTTHAYCWANNDMATYKPLYGALYNWFAVTNTKLCPTGWRVASDDDFKTLEIALGMTQTQAGATEWRGTDQGKQMKNITGWSTGQNGTNSSGFTAMPAGYRSYATGISEGIGMLTYWWTSTQQDASIAVYRRVDGDNDKVYRSGTYKRAGKSVRCIKN
ncbi:hypothetical protein EG832_17290 [bacterium]|nr:hypothetical protein [bacterium]